MTKTFDTTLNQREQALLISVYKDSREKHSAEEHLEELSLLTKTYGAEVVGKETCLIKKIDASTFLTKGKLEEMVELAKEKGANLVIIDDEIAPSQQRNLEKVFGIAVIDRTELILEVFRQRAESKEAKLQVELAQIRYEAPRLKRLWTHLSRQLGSAGGGASGGGGYLKGEGEKQIEIDRRILKRKIEALQADLKQVEASRALLRTARWRSKIPTFALVGYTNAGKSTLMNALTKAEVFVEDKLFATLDTTTRKFTLPNNEDVLVIDTVGFIRKLPHHLVAAFKSTLEEAVTADILIHVVDISHKTALDQAKTTMEVLSELNALDRPIIHVLNKVELLEDRKEVIKFKLAYPNTLEISAVTGLGIEELLEKMVEELKKRREVVTLKIPQSEYHVVSEVIKLGALIQTDYEENDIIIKVELPQIVVGRLKRYIVKS